MTPGRDGAVLLVDEYFPITVLEVLANQVAVRRTHVVLAANAGIKPDAPTGFQQPVIQFIVLVPRQCRIKPANLFQCLSAVSTKGYRIHMAGAPAGSEAGIPYAERRAHGGSDALRGLGSVHLFHHTPDTP